MSGEGARGGVIFFSAHFTFQAISRGFFLKKIDEHFLGSLKCRQTLFNAQIVFYKDFYDFFRFTRPSKIVNAFPSFAIHLRVANLRPTYLHQTCSSRDMAKYVGKILEYKREKEKVLKKWSKFILKWNYCSKCAEISFCCRFWSLGATNQISAWDLKVTQ